MHDCPSHTSTKSQASERERMVRALEVRAAEAEGGDAAGRGARQQVRSGAGNMLLSSAFASRTNV